VIGARGCFSTAVESLNLSILPKLLGEAT